MNTKIICGYCEEVLPTLPTPRMVWLDPPDGIGKRYGVCEDRYDHYDQQLMKWTLNAIHANSDIVWISHRPQSLYMLQSYAYSELGLEDRLFIWRYTFGQHCNHDCGHGYRPILRLSKSDVVWNVDAIRVESERQRLGDKRADPRGRVPDDVFEFPRVCGTFKERCAYHPTQHPIALMKRVVAMSCKPGETAVDMFGGTFSMAKACVELGVSSTSIEIDPYYCEQGALALGLKQTSPTTWEN